LGNLLKKLLLEDRQGNGTIKLKLIFGNQNVKIELSQSCPMVDSGISNNNVGSATTGLGDWLLLKSVVSETEFVIGISYTFKYFSNILI
jgi:hypothetical protein